MFGGRPRWLEDGRDDTNKPGQTTNHRQKQKDRNDMTFYRYKMELKRL